MQTRNELIKKHSLPVSYKAYLFSRNALFLIINSKFMATHDIPESIIKEYDAQANAIHARRERMEHLLTFPKSFDLRYQFALVLYYTIRETKPKVVIETGVGNGFSSCIILAALNKNKKGTLYSIDVEPTVGQLTEGIDKSRCKLIIGKPRKSLIDLLKKVKKVDIFFHDSDHSYENMKFEYEEVAKKMSRGSVLMSDDVSMTNAFMEFSNTKAMVPKIIPHYRRSFGILRF